MFSAHAFWGKVMKSKPNSRMKRKSNMATAPPPDKRQPGLSLVIGVGRNADDPEAVALADVFSEELRLAVCRFLAGYVRLKVHPAVIVCVDSKPDSPK